MSKFQRNAIVISACILTAVILILVLLLSGRVADNPAGTVGNTAGNLYNSGLFCEYDGTVYFANPTQGGSLYAMNPDESDVRRLNDLQVRNILAGGDYLYFFQTGAASHSGFGQLQGIKSFDRCKRNGKNITSIARNVVLSGQLVDNYLYLLTSSSSGNALYKIKTDKSEQIKVTDMPINPACAWDGKIYYNGVSENHYLYSLNTKDDTVSEIWQGNLWYPVIDGEYVYYLDVENNYRICRYSLVRQEIEVLTNDRVDCFNVGKGYIYYQQAGKNPRLMCMHTDGSNRYVLAEGVFTNINMTSNYVYFQAFDDESILFHSALGSSVYSAFLPE
ncbi:MAG: DUF5050 domain-containing protein [Acetatifactor sp.]